MTMSVALDPGSGEGDLTAVLRKIAVEGAPRLFAVLHEHRERGDVSLAAWGMAFRNRVEVVSVEGTRRMSLTSVERVRFMYARQEAVTHVVWLDGTGAEATK